MPIRVLPPQLANQIAAGEVVERPSSVIKELVENSLDAGATQIHIEIEQGGAKLIRIRDNGNGIEKDELELALSRHATSKISTLDDLEKITSLGFRGEALASISSVSRLTLISKTAEQDEAWLAYTEGLQMGVTVKPTAHPTGTTVEVLDLFYNTPARRKFLRTEKTEFAHIDEVLRRLALVNPSVTFSLQHNGKQTRDYRVGSGQQKEQRLQNICGKSFVEHAAVVSWEYNDLQIEGWVIPSRFIEKSTLIQYTYVNGRVMRDRLLSHAIRQAYQNQLKDDQQPTYVLFLNIDPHEVDVNVHPAKQEVRFNQSRLVHDFVCQAIMMALQPSDDNVMISSVEDNYNQSETAIRENRPAAGKNQFHYAIENPHGSAIRLKQEQRNYQQLLNPAPMQDQALRNEFNDSVKISNSIDEEEIKPALFPNPPLSPMPIQPYRQNSESSVQIGRVLTVWKECYAIMEYQNGLVMLSLTIADKLLKKYQFGYNNANEVRSQPLLIPLLLPVSEQESRICQKYQDLLQSIGISLLILKGKIEVKSVPGPLRQQNLQQIFPALLSYLNEHDEITLESVIEWLSQKVCDSPKTWTLAQSVQIIGELERVYPKIWQQAPKGLLYYIDLNEKLSTLQ